MSYRTALLVLIVAAAFLYLRGPSAGRVVNNTVLAPEAGYIQYKSVRYTAEWGPDVVHTGEVRLIDRAKYKPAPFFTHHAVVTTGDFSDPDFVKIGDAKGGNFYWTSKDRPTGTIVALHLIPSDKTVLKSLQRIGTGDRIEFQGREEIDGSIEGADGSYLRLQHDNHRYLLVKRATPAAE